jgi:hypothetical protein
MEESNIKLGYGIIEVKCPLCPPNTVWHMYVGEGISCNDYCSTCSKQYCEDHLYPMQCCDQFYCKACMDLLPKCTQCSNPLCLDSWRKPICRICTKTPHIRLF